MNNKAINEFGFRRIWRIKQISEGVIHLRSAFGLADENGSAIAVIDGSIWSLRLLDEDRGNLGPTT